MEIKIKPHIMAILIRIVTVVLLCFIVLTLKAQDLQTLLKTAEQGVPDSQYHIGIVYLEGTTTVAKDVAKGIFWLQKASEGGDYLARYRLAKCYYEGEGVGKDMQKAFVLYLKAANQGLSSAQKEVGRCYYYGYGVDMNRVEAFKWFLKSAQQEREENDTYEAKVYLSKCYVYGYGVDKDVIKGFRICSDLAEKGYFAAQTLLSEYYSKGLGCEKDYNKSFSWAIKAAKQGYALAQVKVAEHYAQGKGTKLNYKGAVIWLEKAIKQNEASAYTEMARMYMRGRGVERDFDKALELIDNALDLEPEGLLHLDAKGELYARKGEKEKALELKDLISTKDKRFLQDNKTAFYKYIKGWESGAVDYNVPTSSEINPDIFAVIIAEENYQHESKVPHALNDGEVFEQYCRMTLGIPDENIKFVGDATLNDIKYNINWVKNVMKAYNGEAKVIFYYAGHGIPDEANKTAYLLPIDGNGSDVTTGYALSDLNTAFSEMPAKSVNIFLDACFSGTKREGDMLASARGVAIKVKDEAPKGNVVVFSAAQGDETAYPFEEEEHGMFTYYLLKKLQETKGDVTLEELGKYVTAQVSRQSIVVNGKSQTPTLSPSPILGDGWKSWKLK